MPKHRSNAPVTAELLAAWRVAAEALERAAESAEEQFAGAEWRDFLNARLSSLLGHAARSEVVQQQLASMSAQELEQRTSAFAALLAGWLWNPDRHDFLGGGREPE